jgi:hypothetical protein
MGMKALLFIVLSFILFPSISCGDTLYEVAICTFTTRLEAAKIAQMASSEMHIALARESLKAPSSKVLYQGNVASVAAIAEGGFRVLTYVGPGEGSTVLADTKKFFKNAWSFEVPEASVELNQDYYAYASVPVLILGSEKNYAVARKKAVEISRKSGVRFSDRGLVYDPKNGLRSPANDSDELDAGTYSVRRYDNDCGANQKPPCITLERSEFYSGLRPNLYIIVGGVGAEPTRLSDFKKVVPDAYEKKAVLYMGCIH